MSVKRWVVMLAVVAAVGCGEEPYGEVSVATFNVALAGDGAPLSDERRAPVAAAVAELDADVICLQEVWEPASLRAIEAAGVYDTIVRHPDAEQVSSCSPLGLDAAEECMAEACPDACGLDLLGCIEDACGLVSSRTVDGGCISCAMETDNGCPDEIRSTCEGTGEGEFLFAGHDTALLTRRPTLETDTFALSSTLVPTAITFAKVDSEAGPVDVYCAHFASSIAGIEYFGPHGSWIGEREFQIQQTLDYIQEKSGNTRRVVLLGDLNERVGRERLLAFEAAGLRSADEAGDPGCTVCTDNLVSPSSSDGRVDHVYLGDRLNAVSFERIFDAPITVEVIGSDPVETAETHLSDHYGLRAVLSN